MKAIAAFLLLFIPGFTQLACAEPLPVKAYANLPYIDDVSLSPSGKYLSYMTNYQGALILLVQNLENGKMFPIMKSDNVSVRVNWYLWANDNILLVSGSYPDTRYGTKVTESRLMKINLNNIDEGLKPVIRARRKEHVPQHGDNLVSLLPDEPEHILLAADLDNPNRPSVYKINLESGKRQKVQRSKSYIVDWYADQQGRIRLGLGRDETRIFYRYQDLKTNEWRNIWEYEILNAPDIDVLGFDLDPNILYIRAEHQGRYALFKVNMQDPELKQELVFADEKYDFDGRILRSAKTREVIGFSHSNLQNTRHYWHKDYQKLQNGLNRVLPDANNYIIDMDKHQNRYVLYTSSDKDAGSYYLGDRKHKALDYLASEYPLINDKNYAGKQKVHYQARDGLKIEAYLTLPVDYQQGQKRPAVILPHGGPMARDYAGFDYWSEFLANNGYVVLQPNFRGSSGYGIEFEQMGIKGWGKAMQDDLQDAAHWLIEQGAVDKDKMCIAGASYGGYAALMSAALHSDSFKCAASFAGVTDLERIVSYARRFTNKKVVERQLGKDWDALEATSPVNLAEQITIPVLLIHGEDDRVVRVVHSQQMHEALEDEDKQVEYIELPQGDHYLSAQQNRVKALDAILKFLNKHLKN